MKLREWSEKAGIKYQTAYRWFKAGTLPVNAYQTDSGTIIVDDVVEKSMPNNSSDIISLFLEKTVEFSNNNSTVTDFAAYVLSNFSLKPNTGSNFPVYSKNMPKSEDVQKHFQQLLKPKGEKPKSNMFIPRIEDLESLAQNGDFPIQDLQDLKEILSTSILPLNNLTVTSAVNSNTTGGEVFHSANITPQSCSNYFSSSVLGNNEINSSTTFNANSVNIPSPEKIEVMQQSLIKVAEDIRKTSKRGRKPKRK